MNDDELLLLANDLRETLRSLNAGKVLALWADTTFTVEPFSFWGRSLQDGSVERPVATFVAGVDPPLEEIAEKLRLALPKLER